MEGPTEYFLKFLFYLKVQFFRLIMENNFIQVAGSAGHAVDYTIGPIFTNCLRLVGVTQLSLTSSHK